MLLQRYSQEIDGFLVGEFTTDTRTIETTMTTTVKEKTAINTSFLRGGIFTRQTIIKGSERTV